MHELHALEDPAAAITLGVAALYHLSPAKNACLRRCRSPFDFVLHHWRDGRLGALWMGLVHGTWCIGCCAGLMLALFTLGVMNVALMAALAALVLIEKVTPFGVGFGRASGVALAGLAAFFAVA
jgi:predicted metal-binding membrane protein